MKIFVVLLSIALCSHLKCVHAVQGRQNRVCKGGNFQPPSPRFYRNEKNYSFKRPWPTEGQLISNCPFGVFGSTEKPTKSF